jgi:demethylmenaquinone methyltransferase/2-methoxy-6-polyprenyl-1,4-benzoquinol methylase
MGEREEYYDRRAAEYDESITAGLDTETAAAFAQELAALGPVLTGLPPGRVLDVACGTALFTQHLLGQVVALDQSAGMLMVARGKIPTAQLVQAAVAALPFAGMAFDRLVTSHFYGHLVEVERVAFVAEARRVAPELVVVDTAASDTAAPDGWQERVLRNGSRYTIYKRHFTPAQLLAELGGDGEVLFAGRFFVAVRSCRSRPEAIAGLRDAPAFTADRLEA